MPRAWIASGMILAAAVACTRPAPVLSPSTTVPRHVRVQVIERGRPAVQKVPLEEYVLAVVINEFSPAAGEADLAERMLEIQAIVARTYAVTHFRRHTREGFDLCATTHCQLFDPSRLRSSRWERAATAAVTRTTDLLLWHDGGPARALYHADCGGHTSGAFEVWGGDDPPYLAARSDSGPARDAHTTWEYTLAADALQRALNSDARTRVGHHLTGLDVSRRDRAGRASRVTLRGERDVVVSGDELRQVLSRALGPRTIRSTLFDVRRERSGFRFTGRGYGHGVGLCQAGALARLRAGWNVQRVLQHYFPGTRLARATNGRPAVGRR